MKGHRIKARFNFADAYDDQTAKNAISSFDRNGRVNMEE